MKSSGLRCTPLVLLAALGFALPAGVAQSADGTPNEVMANNRLFAVVEKIYGPALASLNLSVEKLTSVKALLVDRIVARQSAAKTMPLGRAIDRQKEAIAQAEGGVDRKIQAIVEPAIFARIHEMTFVEQELDNIELTYAPEMAAAGVPLDGPRAVALARVFKVVYTDAETALAGTTDFAAIRAAKTLEEKARAEAPMMDYRAYRTRDVDAGGLSAADREAIRQAASFLSPDQLVILQKKLAEVTRGDLRLQAERQSGSARSKATEAP